jgi:hypothetical protein
MAHPQGDPAPSWPRRLAEALLPAVLLTFVALYLLGVAAGVEPEWALGRAAGVALLLAVLARIARGVLDSLQDSAPLADPLAPRDVSTGASQPPPAPAADAPGATEPTVGPQAEVPAGSN